MKKIILLPIFLLFGYTTYAQKKITYGVGLDIFQTKLNNVDRENYTGHGHSVPGFKQNDKLGFGATFLASTPIYKNLSFETGLGVTNFRSQFHYNYDHRFLGWIDRKLNISLYYLNLPLGLSYNIPIGSFSTINFSLGANFRFLFLGQDNYQEIIFETILLPKARYNFFIPSLNVVSGYNLTLNTGNQIRLEAFMGRDLKSTIGKERGEWGFYKNLSSASYQFYGISIKYFFTK